MNPDAGTILANINAQQAQTGQPQQSVQPQHGNWFTHLLPTGGSIAGGAGGAALGTMILPGIGTIAGGILGAALGGGVSKAVENTTEGKGIGNGVLSSAVEGGVGQAAGGVAGKVLGKGAQLLAGRAKNIEEVATTAGNKVASDTAAETAAKGMKNTYADVPKGLQKSYDAEGQANLVKSFGGDPTDPQHLLDISGNANDVLNSNLNGVLSGSGTRDLSDYNQIVKDAVGKNGFNLGSSDPTALSKGRLGPSNTPAAKLVTQLQQHRMGLAHNAADPIEVRSLISRLQGLAADAKPGISAVSGAKDPDQVATYKSINDIVGQLKDRLYNNDAVKAGVTGLKGNLQATDVGGNQLLADHLNGILDTATEGQHILTPMSGFTNMSKLGGAVNDAQKIVGSPAALARKTADLNGDGVADALQKPSLSTVAGIVGDGKPLSVAGRAVAHTVNNPTILNTLSRMGNLTAKIAPAAGVAVATSPNLAADPVNGTMGADMNPQQMGQGTAPGQNDLQRYIDAMEAQSVLAPNLGGAGASFMQSIAPMLQKNQLLGSELNAIPAGFNNAGGAQGTGGILSRISGLIPGTAAHTYQAQQDAAAAQLAQSLGISPQQAAGLLPQLMQNQQSAGIPQGILSQLQGQLVR